uniref:Uncharacterized protein n=1 Tax=Tanacetum cinerariifolium TaxID=118510 RepID=A0A699IKL5_TANCI|nr:hypothetical protein [Tanacetum cinerariifolium]
MNGKSHTVNIDNFGDMLQIRLKLPGQKFKDPLFENEILSFIRDLGHTREIKVLSDVDVKHMHQPWRSFVFIINKCLSGAHEGTGVSPGVPDVATYGSDDEQISWKSSDDEDDDDADNQGDNDEDDNDADNQGDDNQDDDNEQTEPDNDGDDFVHPKLSTFDEKERHNEEEEGSDLRVQTPSQFESTDDEAYNDVTQGDNVKEEKLDEESFVSSGFISNMLNPNPNTGIDSILNLNTESTSLVDVTVTTNLEILSSYVTTLPSLPIPPIQPQQQTSAPSLVIVLSTSLQNLPTFGSLFKFKDRVKDLEDDFSEFKQTNLFTKTVSSILGIIDTIGKPVNEQLKAEVLACSSNEAKTSHAVAANLSELELKKILIDKMKRNKSIYRSYQQKTLYKALIDAYETDKVILDTYGDTVMIKRCQDDEDDDEEPFAGSNRKSKKRRARKEPKLTSKLKEKTSKSIGKSKEWSKLLKTKIRIFQVQTSGSGIFNLLVVATTFTGSGNLYCQWEHLTWHANSWQWDLHSSGSGNTLHWQWELIMPVGTLS